MICSPRATLYRAGAAYSSTILLRPVPAIIWHQWAPIKGTLAPNAKAIMPPATQTASEIFPTTLPTSRPPPKLRRKYSRQPSRQPSRHLSATKKCREA
jgi:hypothetical protein